MDHGHLVVLFQGAILERFVYPSGAAHPEHLKLDCPKCAHVGATENMDAPFHDPHDLFVPDGGHVLEIAIDNADGMRPRSPQPVNVPLGHRRKIGGVEFSSRGWHGKRRAEKDECAGHRPAARSIARRPGRQDGISSTGPSSPGTMTRTTGTPNSSRLRSTAIACLIPAEWCCRGHRRSTSAASGTPR